MKQGFKSIAQAGWKGFARFATCDLRQKIEPLTQLEEHGRSFKFDHHGAIRLFAPMLKFYNAHVAP
jgi:hypothetical protein